MNDVVMGFIRSLEIAEKQSHRNIEILPVIAAQAGPAYLTLSEALDDKLISVLEVSQGGSVPELKVINRGLKPILLLDGEELAGAKQNRVLNTSVLVPGNREILIPVSCTEQGRWSYLTDVFYASGNVMAQKIRAAKLRAVSCSLEEKEGFQSNQGEVWDGIAELQEKAGVRSPTMAMRDVFEARKEAIEEANKAFGLVKGQSGLIEVIDGKVAGMDILSSASAYARLHTKLVNSYVMGGLTGKKSSGTKKSGVAPKKVTAFVESLLTCDEKMFKSVGLGDDYRYTSDHLAGSALVHDSAVIHMAFFHVDPVHKNKQEPPIAGLHRRRSYRCVTEREEEGELL